MANLSMRMQPTKKPEEKNAKSTRQHVVVEEIEVPVVEDQKGTNNKQYRRKDLKFRRKSKGNVKDLKRKLEIAKHQQKRKDAAASALDDLGNPWDNMNYMDKKRFGLYYYYNYVVSHPKYGFHTEALHHAAEMVKVSP